MRINNGPNCANFGGPRLRQWFAADALPPTENPKNLIFFFGFLGIF